MIGWVIGAGVYFAGWFAGAACASHYWGESDLSYRAALAGLLWPLTAVNRLRKIPAEAFRDAWAYVRGRSDA